jgi:ABC-2 type transport system permease protein
MTVTTPSTATPAVTTGGTVVPGRTQLVRSELRKIFTTNSWWLLGIGLLAFTGMAFLINMASGHSQLRNYEFSVSQPPPNFDEFPPEARPSVAQQQEILAQWQASIDLPGILGRIGANLFTSGQYFGLLFIVILGCLIVTNEFYHQTATATFLATPRRTKVVAAKLGAAVIFATLFWAVTTLISVALGALFFSSNGYDVPLGDADVWRAVGMNLLAYVVWAVLGVAIGVLLRSQIGSTITCVVLYLISLPATLLLFALLREYVIKTDEIWKFTVIVPSIASMVMVSDGPVDALPEGASPAWWVGLIVLLAYGVVAGVTGTLITRRRDIS